MVCVCQFSITPAPAAGAAPASGPSDRGSDSVSPTSQLGKFLFVASLVCFSGLEVARHESSELTWEIPMHAGRMWGVDG